MIRAISIILAAAWMLFIYSMSAKDAASSSVLSSGICYRICSIFVKGFEEMDMETRLEMAASLSFIVRKSAHFIEYTVLGMLYSFCFRAFGTEKPFVWPALSGTLYAVSDELHQIFVPGRSGQISDVLIDAAGSALGAAIVLLIATWIRKRKAKVRQ
ncbi:MAG: VanZ family protein [Firmicutes bacterium]|nr:VanZ family protein [Bacillota bacterium]